MSGFVDNQTVYETLARFVQTPEQKANVQSLLEGHEKLKPLEDRLRAAEAELKSLQSFLTTAKEEEQRLKKRSDELGPAIDTLNFEINALQATETKLSKEVENLQDTVKKLEEQIATLTQAIDQLSAQVAKLEGEVADLTDRIKALESQLKALTERKANLHLTEQEIKARKAVLSGQIDRLEAELKQLQQQETEAKGLLSRYEQELAAAQREIVDQQIAVKDAEEEKTVIRAEDQQVDRDIADENAKITQCETDIASLQQQIDKLADLKANTKDEVRRRGWLIFGRTEHISREPERQRYQQQIDGLRERQRELQPRVTSSRSAVKDLKSRKSQLNREYSNAERRRQAASTLLSHVQNVERTAKANIDASNSKLSQLNSSITRTNDGIRDLKNEFQSLDLKDAELQAEIRRTTKELGDSDSNLRAATDKLAPLQKNVENEIGKRKELIQQRDATQATLTKKQAELHSTQEDQFRAKIRRDELKSELIQVSLALAAASPTVQQVSKSVFDLSPEIALAKRNVKEELQVQAQREIELGFADTLQQIRGELFKKQQNQDQTVVVRVAHQ